MRFTIYVASQSTASFNTGYSQQKKMCAQCSIHDCFLFVHEYATLEVAHSEPNGPGLEPAGNMGRQSEGSRSIEDKLGRGSS